MRRCLRPILVLALPSLLAGCPLGSGGSAGDPDDGPAPDVPGPCQPACDGRVCGPNGCGSVCGSCVIGQACTVTGQCVCMTEGHLECRDGDVWWVDPCGATELQEDCTAGCADAACIPPCIPTCVDRECGDDDCEGTCGDCTEPYGCVDHRCVCAPQAFKECGDGDVWWFDSCGFLGEKAASCGGKGCDQGQCLDCTPDCTGRNCGDDGCGGSCGKCPGGATQCTMEGRCDCTPYCVGKECGADNCLGTCGTCPATHKCINDKCFCARYCTGRVCGPDNCGGSCGTCEEGACINGQCVTSG